MSKLLTWATWLGLGTMLTGGEIPAPPEAEGRVFEDWGRIRDTGSARAAISGTAPVEWAEGGAVRLPVRFVGRDVERASWDIEIDADLRMAKGVQFDFYCGDLSPFSHFSFYFHSGKGWYSASFQPGQAGAWQHVVIDKASTRVEGEPAGWGAVDKVRVSGWRGRDVDTGCAIANLAPAGGKPAVLVLRADSNVPTAGGEAGALLRYAETLSITLDRIGVESAQLADTDLEPELLRDVKLVVLPYNIKVPEEVLGMLHAFVKRGGKLMACYTLRREVGGLLGLRITGYEAPEGRPFSGFSRLGGGLMGQPAFAPQGSQRAHVVEPIGGRPARVVAVWRDARGRDTKIPAITRTESGVFIGHVWFGAKNEESQALMRSLVGNLVPGVWRQTAEREFAKIGTFAGAAGFEEWRSEMPADAPASARSAIDEAVKERDAARRLMEEGDFNGSAEASARANEAALRAWSLCRKSRTPEHRAFWCHSAFGLKNKGWDESIRLLKESGFNAILPNMLWGGLTYYPSEVLPEYAGLAEQGDQVEQCLAACREYGVKCHVWRVNWNTGGKAPKEFIERIRDESRGQVSFKGQANDGWLCPSHPANRELEIESMLELVKRYEVDGIHFDYIRYPGNDNCFCSGCRERFEKELGRSLENWPAVTREDGEVNRRWLDFRRAQITAVVRAVAERARKIRPEVQISAAVFANWPQTRDSIGQDWKLWCEKGWLDFVCPMDYIDSNPLFRNTVENQKEWAGKVPLYPGMGLSVWKNPGDAVKIAQQIEIVRELGVPGFTVFNYDGNAEAVLPYLKLGVTRE
jgi:uncharacterized lipoprotein YddW (UPF0748 family)